MKPLSKNQFNALDRIANGARIWRANNRAGRELWWLSPQDDLKPVEPINANTGRALAKAGYIEPTGALYWRLTDAGRAALAKESGPA